MNKIEIKYLALVLTGCLLLAACGDEKVTPKHVEEKQSKDLPTNEVDVSENKDSLNRPEVQRKIIQVEIGDLDDLVALFDSYGYTRENWKKGNREVPRITFDGVSDAWRESSSNLPVNQKKEIFFKMMGPLVLISNEKILAERKKIKSLALDSPELMALMLRYKIIKNDNEAIDESMRESLLVRVDQIPPSLALAQAAEESGWATSRFTSEGNAFFGQWTFTGKGMKPKQQRQELGNYGIARFDTPLASVESYMYNINVSAAYAKLRGMRAENRKAGTPSRGLELAVALDRYSERGQAYVDGIQQMIRYNQLDQVDEAFLTQEYELHLVTKNARARE